MLKISATMPLGELQQNVELVFLVSVAVDPENAEAFGWTLAEPDRSIRRGRPILQIDVPDSVELLEQPPGEFTTSEDVLTSYLGMPYGRRLLTGETQIAFRLVSEPKADDVIALNVIGYLGDDSPGGAHFVRRRVHLPVASGAKAVVVVASNSGWGKGNLLNIGDVADDFELPGLDGQSVRLSSFRGQEIIVTTYRGQW